MDGYCVIQFRNKREKSKVLGLLVETESKFIVTTDLKDISKGFESNITEKNQGLRDEATNTECIGEIGTIRHEGVEKENKPLVVENVVVMDSGRFSERVLGTTINNNIGFVAPTIEKPPLSPFTDPFLNVEQPVETEDDDEKEEEEEVDVVKMDEDKDKEDDVEEEKIEEEEDKNVSILETPNTRRSGRALKRPRYLMNDDSIYSPMAVKNQKEEPKPDLCEKCGILVDGYEAKHEHVVTHIFKKFKCTVTTCGYRTGDRGEIEEHLELEHSLLGKSFKESKLTADQLDAVDTQMEEFFPRVIKPKEGSCQLCGVMADRQLAHAISHLDFMLFKCMVDGCQYEGKTVGAIKGHITKGHERKGNFEKIVLSEEQQEEFDGIVDRCFPATDAANDTIGESEE